ncbi:Ubiquitin-like-specific protease 2B [Melia azedarach]|uniref:Ubiquitin-like-specific protease 2B n=1 Tax=Melia azedarach TaxID=155640 RepID=A0ACC1Y0T3_MELAZ|nr:Ubiquitin-like-specific protease 2B [Melia azedarach]
MSRLSGKKKYEVFEFNKEDDRVEVLSKKLLGKFANQRKKERRSSTVDKYTFLQCFAQGTKPQQKTIGSELIDIDARDAHSAQFQHVEISNEPIDVDAGDGAFREFSGLDTASLSNYINHENEQVGLILGEDDCIEMSSPTNSSSPLADNGAISVSSEEQVAECGSCEHEIDNINKMVVVFPDFLLYGGNICKDSKITFSCSSVKVEGSIVNESRETFSFEWTIGDIISILSEWSGSIETAAVYLSHKSKDSTAASNVNEISEKSAGIEMLSFVVCDLHWPEKLEAIKSLDVRYKDKWNDIFDPRTIYEENAFLCQKSKLLSKQYSFQIDEPFEDVIYPKGDPDAVLISKRDVELLVPETFVNDTIIDFYIKYLKNNLQPEEQHHFHFFNSFFFRKLADLDKDSSSACEGRAAFQRVRKWTRKVNLFEKDYIFIPVNYSFHWSLIVICHPGEVAYFKDDETEKSLKVPCILHMDSIKGSHRGLKNLIRSYLCEEWKERHSNTGDKIPSKFLGLRFVPLQLNWNWFPPAEASMKRARIKKLIYEIYEDPSHKEDPSTDCIDEHPLSQSRTDKNGKENRAVFLGQTWCPTITGQQGFTSISDAEKGIGISILRNSPQRDRHCSRDPEFIFREQCQQGTSPGAFSDIRYQQVTACYQKGILSPIEEAEENYEQMDNSPYDAEHLQQATALATETPTTSYVCGDCRVRQKTNCDQRFSQHFELLDESMKECQSSSEVELDADQPLAEHEGSNYLETADKPETSSTSSDDIAVFVVEDSQEENGRIPALIVEDSEEENGGLAVLEDSEEENGGLAVLEDSEEENGGIAVLVEDSEEENCMEDAKRNKDSPFSKGETCPLSPQKCLPETICLEENIKLTRNEVPLSKADKQ